MSLAITSPINPSPRTKPHLITAPRLSRTTRMITTSSLPSMQVSNASHHALIPPTIRNPVNQPLGFDPTDPRMLARAYNHSLGSWIRTIVLTSYRIRQAIGWERRRPPRSSPRLTPRTSPWPSGRPPSALEQVGVPMLLLLDPRYVSTSFPSF